MRATSEAHLDGAKIEITASPIERRPNDAMACASGAGVAALGSTTVVPPWPSEERVKVDFV
jgi:hypothetical protein